MSAGNSRLLLIPLLLHAAASRHSLLKLITEHPLLAREAPSTQQMQPINVALYINALHDVDELVHGTLGQRRP